MTVPESRQVRRARERQEQRQRFDQIHGDVLKGRTVRDMWKVYAGNRFKATGIDIDGPEASATIKHGFYAGAASMLELMMRVSPDDVSEEQGVEMLERLREELESYAKGKRQQ